MARGYRPDIDGLRAIAVLAVIANHIDDRWLPSGHLGVDVFFVISGYVITLSLQGRDGDALWPFLRDFYRRRFKRLYPALLPCIALTAVAISLVDPTAGEYPLKTALAAVFGLANIQLHHAASDYFASAGALNPFIHLWSLGVEEQFYLLFPALWWLVRASRRAQLVAFGLISAASVAAFAAWFPSLESFYLPHLRAWELGVGALIATGRWALPAPQWVRAAAFAALALCLALPPQLWNSLAAVAATAALLTAGGGRALELGAVRYVGRLSYSLYLWHWPVLVLGRWTIGLGPASVLVLVLAMFALAAASFHLAERPLRYRTWPRFAPAWSGGVVAVVTAGVFALDEPLAGKLYLGQRADLVQREAGSLLTSYELPGYGRWDGLACTFREPGQPLDLASCTLGSGPRVLVIGNSYAAAFVHGFVPTLRLGRAVTVLSAWGASAVPARIEGPFSAINADWWSRIVPAAMAELRPGDTVLIVTGLTYADPAVVEPGLRRLSATLASRGVDLAMVEGLPYVRESGCKPEAAIPQWYSPGGGICELYTREETLAMRAPMSEMFARLSAEGVLTSIDLFDVFCPGTVCGYQAHGVVLYRDEFSHPSVESMRFVGPRIAAALKSG
jgi:peptidoglycan/LPS O-acetylase OafA/YrhL